MQESEKESNWLLRLLKYVKKRKGKIATSIIVGIIGIVRIGTLLCGSTNSGSGLESEFIAGVLDAILRFGRSRIPCKAYIP